jgi:predicted O-methyltransferase YrrM
MEKFNLSHLEDNRDVAAIHNDESLLLYSVVKCNRIERILEIGGGEISFSAINFLRAQENFTNATVYTVDINPVKKLSENHKVIKKDCNDLLPSDLDNKPIDLIFFDCHLIIAQLNLYNLLKEHNLITEDTIIVLHDTNLFYEPYVWEKDYIGDYNIPFDKVGGGVCTSMG